VEEAAPSPTCVTALGATLYVVPFVSPVIDTGLVV
jgi:hypothetical protein